jgi:beta-glucosidase
MKKILKALAYMVFALVVIFLSFFTFFYIKSSIIHNDNMALLGNEAPLLTIAGHNFRDLNKNGKLDKYEDVRLLVSERVDNLASQMSLEEKAGLMFITMLAMDKDGSLVNKVNLLNPFTLLFDGTSTMLAKKRMNHFNTVDTPNSPDAMIKWNNDLQKMAEKTRLGIPVTIATDPRHGVPNAAPGISINTPFFSNWCSPLGFAAIGDTALVREFGDIARQEYIATGLRVSLSPMADLATEPRWTRINGTFGEDAELAAKLTRAYISGFQGDSITNQSVACMVKHFSGGGPQDDGMDSHFPPGRQAYPGNNFNYHLIPFERGAFAANVSQIMPYYGIPVGQTNEDVGFGYNKQIITGLLREKYHFDRIVCTDWALISDVAAIGLMFKPASAHGVEKLSASERVAKIIDAGCDMFGGESLPDFIVDLLKSGKITEERINISVKRILREKFRLGLFDNPYLKAENAAILRNEKFLEKGKESQRRSLVLLKNDTDILPLKLKTKVYLQGFDDEETKKYVDAKASLQEADVVIEMFS